MTNLDCGTHQNYTTYFSIPTNSELEMSEPPSQDQKFVKCMLSDIAELLNFDMNRRLLYTSKYNFYNPLVKVCREIMEYMSFEYNLHSALYRVRNKFIIARKKYILMAFVECNCYESGQCDLSKSRHYANSRTCDSAAKWVGAVAEIYDKLINPDTIEKNVKATML